MSEKPAFPPSATKAVPNFEPDLSPQSVHNREAAKAHGLRYDPQKRCYVDEDGCLIRDRFGQPL